MVRSVAAIAIGFCFIALLSLGADALMRQTLPNFFDPSGRMTQAPVLGIVPFPFLPTSRKDLRDAGKWIKPAS